MRNAKDFFANLVSSNGEVSSRRVVVIITAINFTLFSIVFPVVMYGFIIRERNEKIILRSFDILDKQIDYQFWLMCVGFGFITTSAFAQALIMKAKAKVVSAVQGDDNPDTVINQDVENQTIDTGQTNVNAGKNVKKGPVKKTGTKKRVPHE